MQLSDFAHVFHVKIMLRPLRFFSKQKIYVKNSVDHYIFAAKNSASCQKIANFEMGTNCLDLKKERLKIRETFSLFFEIYSNIQIVEKKTVAAGSGVYSDSERHS